MTIHYKITKLAGMVFRMAKKNIQRNGINALWWSGVKNFGDLLTPELFDYYGKTAINSKPDKADVVGVGSILHLLPKDYSGTILGSGLIKNEKLSLEKANFSFVRGELTKAVMNLPELTPTGDLGLLSPKLLNRNNLKKKYKVGLVPHYVDKGNPWVLGMMSKLGPSGLLIDVQDSAKNVINKIAMCDVIYSSSLHGIIVADSLHIPNVWIQISNSIVGAGFKFHDYNTSIDFEQSPLPISAIKSHLDLDRFTCQKKTQIIDNKIKDLDLLLTKILNA